MLTIERGRLIPGLPAAGARDLAAAIARLEKHLVQVVARVAALLAASQALAAKAARLCQIKGVGPGTAATLLGHLPELGQGQVGGAQAAALAGLAPFADDRGPRRGPRHRAGAAPACARRSTWRLLTPAAPTPSSKPSTSACARRASPSKLPSSPTARKLLCTLDTLLQGPHFTPCS